MAVSAAAVTGLYQSLLGRAPDAGGLSYYQNYASPAAVQASIQGSSEYKAKSSGSSSSSNLFATPSAATSADQNSLNSYLTSSTNGMNALLDQQNTEQQGLFNQYSAAQAAQTKLPDLYTNLTTQAGIPDITNQLQGYKNQIYRTQGLLDNLNSDVQSRTNGTNTTQAQLDASIAAESNPLQKTLSDLGTGMQPLTDQLTSAENSVSTMMPLYEQQQQADLQPLTLQINSLSDKYAREMTGYTTDQKNQLDALTAKLTRDQTLDDQQWTSLQALAKQEADYTQAVKVAQINASSPAATGIGSYLMPSTAAAPAATTVRQLPTISVPGATQSNSVALQGGSSNMLQGYSGNLQ